MELRGICRKHNKDRHHGHGHDGLRRFAVAPFLRKTPSARAVLSIFHLLHQSNPPHACCFENNPKPNRWLPDLVPSPKNNLMCVATHPGRWACGERFRLGNS
jgi:hypothetical protein